MGKENKKMTINGKQFIKKKNHGLLGTVCIVGMLLVLVLIVSYSNINSSKNFVAKQLSLGNKYLAELDYEQAIVAFNKVIEIDPSIKEAYFGLAEVYIAQEDYVSAKSILEQGYEIIRDEEFKIRIEEVKHLEEISDAGINIVQDIESESQVEGEKVADIKQGIFSSKETVEVCEKIMEAYQNEEFDYANELYSSWFYENYEEILRIEDYIILVENDEYGIGVYKNNMDVYMYCGEFINGNRDGIGLYMGAGNEYADLDTISKFIVYTIGEWKNDMPNGQHRLKTYDKTEEMHGEIVWEKSLEVLGNVTNGIWDGEICEKSFFRDYDNETMYNISYNFICENGKVQILNSEKLEDRNIFLVGRGKSSVMYSLGEEIIHNCNLYVYEEGIEAVHGLYHFGYGETFPLGTSWVENEQ